MTPRITCRIVDARWREIGATARLARAAANAAFAVAPPPFARPTVAIVMTSDADIRRLNAQWLGKDTATNVLSFPAPAAAKGAAGASLGDIALAYETLRREADEASIAMTDHLAHLVVHGVLHLVGHDHQSHRQASVMEALEVAALARLGIADPHAGRALVVRRAKGAA